jgi:hypothetical protein
MDMDMRSGAFSCAFEFTSSHQQRGLAYHNIGCENLEAREYIFMG